MKLLSIAGTAAMFLVGGGILTHGIPGVHDWVHHQTERMHSVPGAGLAFATLIDVVVGVVVGAFALSFVTGIKRWRGPPRTA